MSARMAACSVAAALAASVLAMTPGCSSDTQPAGGLLVVMSADAPLAQQATRLHVEVTPASGGTDYRNLDYALPGATTLPTTMGIASNGNDTASVVIDASLWNGATLLVEQKDQVTEIPTGRVAELDIVFASVCTGVSCSGDESCAPSSGRCISDLVDASQLMTYGGDAGGGAVDGGDADATVIPPAEGEGGTGSGADSGPAPCSATTCPSGCCGTDGACHQDEGAASCGTDGQSCTTCTAAQTCSGGSCADTCTPSNCATGCCDASGTCVTATGDGACGTNGARCGACTGSNHCESGACGCATSADCPAQQACDPTKHTCSSACSSTATCHGGCCDLTTSTCEEGTGDATCGAGGGACTSCAGNASGSYCEAGGTCGCNVAGDCPAEDACNPTTHRCSSSCAGGLACNGGCCNVNTTTCVSPASTECNGTTPQTCNAVGQWVNGPIAAGTCTAVCNPGAHQCAGPGNATNQTCNSTGSAWVSDPVTAGVCGAACSVGTAQCGQSGEPVVDASSPDGTFLQETGNATNYPYLQTCTASGQWSTPGACTKTININGFSAGEVCGNCHGTVECGVQGWSTYTGTVSCP